MLLWVPSFMIMKTVKLAASVLGLLLLLVLIILPGIFSVNVFTHELYHVFRHQDAAKSVCVDINNRPFVAHTVVSFPNVSSMRTYVETVEDGEEDVASAVGKWSSVVYVVFCLVAVFLIGVIVADSVGPRIVYRARRLRKHIRKHLKRKR